MKILSNWIGHLEKSIEKSAGCGHIDLSKLTPEERKKAFVTFGEGSENLTRLLKTAYEHNVESQFCCSDCENSNGYVTFKVTDDNLKYLRDVGKVLSNYDVTTTFEEHYTMGMKVNFCSFNHEPSEHWFGIAADVMENIQNFDCEHPTELYHERIYTHNAPLGNRIQEKLLTILKYFEAEDKLSYCIELLEESLSQGDSVDLTKLTPEEREKAFVTFGEGSESLTRLLKTAYEHNIESRFCCAGHGIDPGYVAFKVTDDNLKYLQDIGKVLSNYDIKTVFSELDKKRTVCFYGLNSEASNDWFVIVADVIENFQSFDCEHPTDLYHGEIRVERDSLGDSFKKMLIKVLKQFKPQNNLLPEGRTNYYDEQKNKFNKKVKLDNIDGKFNPGNTEHQDSKTIKKMKGEREI